MFDDHAIAMPEDFRQGKGDEHLLVVFRLDIIKDEEKSVTEGRPIFRDVDWIKIYIPGDKTTVIDHPAYESDRLRFPQQYARYKQGLKEEEQQVGTPLKEWPLVTRSQVEELKFFNLHMVEQIADVADSVKLKVPGLVSLSQQARIWLDRTKATSDAAKASKKIDDQNSRIGALEIALKDLMEQNERLKKEAGVAQPA